MNEIQNRFYGFYPETLQFFKDLADNNNKQWFDAHRSEYEEFVLDPFRFLVSELAPFMSSIDPHFEVTPAVSKTISRIYRDTRFSKDKSPFRPNMWIVFKRPGRDWHDAPGYFFELFPDWYRYGMGYYAASSKTMAAFRKAIDDNVYKFLEVISFFHETDTYRLEGDDYKKIIDDSKSQRIQEWYQKKNFCLIHNSPVDDTIFSNQLVEHLIRDFEMTIPLYHHLRKLK